MFREIETPIEIIDGEDIVFQWRKRYKDDEGLNWREDEGFNLYDEVSILVQPYGNMVFLSSHNLMKINKDGDVNWATKKELGIMDKGIYPKRPLVVGMDSKNILAFGGFHSFDNLTLYSLARKGTKSSGKMPLGELLEKWSGLDLTSTTLYEKRLILHFGDSNLELNLNESRDITIEGVEKPNGYMPNKYGCFDFEMNSIPDNREVKLNDISLLFLDVERNDGEFGLSPFGRIEVIAPKADNPYIGTLNIPNEMYGLSTATKVGKDLYLCSGRDVHKFTVR